MKKYLQLLPVFLFLFTLAACGPKKNSDLVTFQLNDEFQLGLGKTAKQEPGRLTLTFDAVPEDSRCPEGVNCMWEGRVTVALTAATSEGSQKLVLSREGTPKGPPTKMFEGYTIRLLGVTPYPQKDTKISLQDYQVQLSVGK